MKKDWIYKKLGEVAEIVGGSTPKTDIEEYWGGNHYWVTPAELDGSKYIESTQRTITDKAIEKTNLSLLPSGTVLLSSRAPIGKVCITKSPMYCNQGFKNIVCGDSLYNEFVYYYLCNSVDYLQSLGTGATFKEISKKVVEKVEIPVPSIEEQHQIVAELDLLGDVIEKQKAQIEELDKLSQSIFYDMFGDPESNACNYPIVKLEELCSIITKGTTPTTLGFHFVDEGINFIKVESFNKDESINLHNVAHITEECHKALKRSILEEDDILICIAGTCGRLAIVPPEALPANTNQAFAIVRLKDKENLLSYIYNYLHTSYIRRQIDDLKKGVAQPNLTLNQIRNLLVLLPPLSLQQEFAAKIEAIEAMKAKVRQSLKESETLFNSRMDYYFN